MASGVPKKLQNRCRNRVNALRICPGSRLSMIGWTTSLCQDLIGRRNSGVQGDRDALAGGFVLDRTTARPLVCVILLNIKNGVSYCVA